MRVYKAADFPVYDWFTLDKESSIFPPPRVFQLIFPVHKTWAQPNAPPSPPSASVLREWCWLVLGACAWDSETDAYLRELKLFFTSVYLISSTACFAAFFGSLIKAHSFSGLRLDHVFFWYACTIRLFLFWQLMMSASMIRCECGTVHRYLPILSYIGWRKCNRSSGCM